MSSGSEVAPDVVIVGAGVVGLTLGVCVAERGLAVRIHTMDRPEATTSAVASAMIGPAISPEGSRAGALERTGIKEFSKLAAVAGNGVALRRGRLVSRERGPSLPGLQACAPDELPTGFATGWWTTLPLVDMPVYLDHLTRRFLTAGGQITYGEVQSLAELAALAPRVANCTGLGARELVPDPDMTASRGQHVVVRNPGLEEFFIEAPFTPAWAAYWPYPDHVILGGIRTVGDENPEPDPAVAGEILCRCIQVEPRLRDAEVLGGQVGMRPERSEARLEAEYIGGTRVVHNYGHGGSGVTMSWGSAYEAAALLLEP